MLLEKLALFQGDSLRLFPHKRGVALEEYAWLTQLLTHLGKRLRKKHSYAIMGSA